MEAVEALPHCMLCSEVQVWDGEFLLLGRFGEPRDVVQHETQEAKQTKDGCPTSCKRKARALGSARQNGHRTMNNLVLCADVYDERIKHRSLMRLLAPKNAIHVGPGLRWRIQASLFPGGFGTDQPKPSYSSSQR